METIAESIEIQYQHLLVVEESELSLGARDALGQSTDINRNILEELNAERTRLPTLVRAHRPEGS